MSRFTAWTLLVNYGAFALWITPYLYRVIHLCKTDQKVQLALSCCAAPPTEECDSSSEGQNSDKKGAENYCLLCTLISYGQDPPGLPADAHLNFPAGLGQWRLLPEFTPSSTFLLSNASRAPPL